MEKLTEMNDQLVQRRIEGILRERNRRSEKNNIGKEPRTEGEPTEQEGDCSTLWPAVEERAAHRV